MIYNNLKKDHVLFEHYISHFLPISYKLWDFLIRFKDKFSHLRILWEITCLYTLNKIFKSSLLTKCHEFLQCRFILQNLLSFDAFQRSTYPFNVILQKFRNIVKQHGILPSKINVLCRKGMNKWISKLLKSAWMTHIRINRNIIVKWI